jgi:hypothetical protein
MGCYAWSCSAPCRDGISRQRLMAHLRIDTMLLGIGEGAQRAHQHAQRCVSSCLNALRRWLGGHHRGGVLVRGGVLHTRRLWGIGQDRERGGSLCEVMTALQAALPAPWWSRCSVGGRLRQRTRPPQQPLKALDAAPSGVHISPTILMWASAPWSEPTLMTLPPVRPGA